MFIKPVITEKTYRLASGDNKTAKQFTFYIDRRLNQITTKKLIEKIYKVNVLNTQVLNTNPLPITFKRVKGQKRAMKKIIVTLKPGQVIKAFEIEENKETANPK